MRPEELCPKHRKAPGDLLTRDNIRPDCKACDKLSALAELRALCPPGTTVYTILRSVSRSGMSRTLSVCIPSPDPTDGRGAMRDLTHLVALIGGYKRKDGWHYNALTVGGCGMDMGFAVVYDLSRALWHGDFTCAGENGNGGKWCPSNDHSNGDRNYNPHQHTDGGYAINHRWL